MIPNYRLILIGLEALWGLFFLGDVAALLGVCFTLTVFSLFFSELGSFLGSRFGGFQGFGPAVLERKI